MNVAAPFALSPISRRVTRSSPDVEALPPGGSELKILAAPP
jgi:hypothetical protein